MELTLSKKLDDAIATVEVNKQTIIRVYQAQKALSNEVKKNSKDIKQIKAQLTASSSGVNLASSIAGRPDWEHELAITGLSDASIADPLLILSKISAILVLPFVETQIDDFKVLPVVKGKSRVLLVRFINVRTRNAWLKAMKTKREILLSDLLPDTPLLEFI